MQYFSSDDEPSGRRPGHDVGFQPHRINAVTGPLNRAEPVVTVLPIAGREGVDAWPRNRGPNSGGRKASSCTAMQSAMVRTRATVSLSISNMETARLSARRRGGPGKPRSCSRAGQVVARHWLQAIDVAGERDALLHRRRRQCDRQAAAYFGEMLLRGDRRGAPGSARAFAALAQHRAVVELDSTSAQRPEL